MNKHIEQSIAKLDQFKQIASDILQQAKSRGASQAEVVVAANKGFSVSARNADVETVEYHQDKSIDITVYFGKRTGTSSLSDLQPAAVRAAVEAACHIAKFTDEDPFAGIAEVDELAFDYPKLDMAYSWPLSVEEAIELACQCEREALAIDKRIMSAEGVDVTTGQGLYLYANSNGFTGSFDHTRHDIGCVLVAKQNGDMQRDYSYSAAVDPQQLRPVKDIAEEAVKRTVGRLGAKRLKTMKVPVIYAAEEARGLLGNFMSAIAGGSIYRKSSFLVDHLGKQVFPSFMQMQERPFLEKALGSAPFDNDGVATRENVFVEDGILRQYMLSVYSARKLGMKTTGNAGGMHNLIVSHGNKSLNELIKTMGKGLLVTEMMGNGTNLITGDYSRGAAGFWIENGEIQYPVHEITVAGKLQDIYAGIQEVANDVDVRGNIRTGSILINEMMVAGT